MANKFEDRLGDLTNAAKDASEKLQSATAGPLWYSTIGEEPEDIVNPFNSVATKEAFGRAQEAKDYDEAITTPKSFRIAQAAKIQNDTLAAMERDTRMRHRPRVRMLAHSAAKAATHGLEDGPLKRGVLFVNRLKEQTDGSDD